MTTNNPDPGAVPGPDSVAEFISIIDQMGPIELRKLADTLTSLASNPLFKNEDTARRMAVAIGKIADNRAAAGIVDREDVE